MLMVSMVCTGPSGRDQANKK